MENTATICRVVEYCTLPIIGAGGGVAVASVIAQENSFLPLGLGVALGGAAVYSLAEIVRNCTGRAEQTYDDLTHELTQLAAARLSHIRAKIKHLETCSAYLGQCIEAYQNILGHIQRMQEPEQV